MANLIKRLDKILTSICKDAGYNLDDIKYTHGRDILSFFVYYNCMWELTIENKLKLYNCCYDKCYRLHKCTECYESELCKHEYELFCGDLKEDYFKGKNITLVIVKDKFYINGTCLILNSKKNIKEYR